MKRSAINVNYTPSFEFEKTYSGKVVGLDEAGIGCWAGDVFAGIAYVPLDTDPRVLGLLQDSKKLTKNQRENALQQFELAGIQVAVATASLEEIDLLNIRGAALKAMERAYEKLGIAATCALIDGTMNPKLSCDLQTLIKGDQRSYSIAAASIAVKVIRDDYMEKLSMEYPMYGWEQNAGYGTKKHQEALKSYGVSPYHRKTYAPIQALL